MCFEAALPNNFQSEDWASFSRMSGRKLLQIEGTRSSVFVPLPLPCCPRPVLLGLPATFMAFLRFKGAEGGSSHRLPCAVFVLLAQELSVPVQTAALRLVQEANFFICTIFCKTREPPRRLCFALSAHAF